MAVYASLLSSIPVPKQQWQTKSDIPVVASVKVADVDDSDSAAIQKKSSDSHTSLFGRYIANLKQKMLETRIKKLESIPEQSRTPVQQAELEANKKSLDCMV